MQAVSKVVKPVVSVVEKPLSMVMKMVMKNKKTLMAVTVVGLAVVGLVVVLRRFLCGGEGFISLEEELDAMKKVEKEMEEEKEDFHDDLKVLRSMKPKRMAWEMSNVTTNQSYDVRGEPMDTLREPVSDILNSELDDNLLNERVMV